MTQEQEMREMIAKGIGYGWCITKDVLAEPGDTVRVGTGARIRISERHGNWPIFDRVINVDKKQIMCPHMFRLLDGDGEVYYEGVIAKEWIEGTEIFAFDPLDWAQGDGCTSLEYRANVTEPWKEL